MKKEKLTKKQFREYISTATNLSVKEIDLLVKNANNPRLDSNGTILVRVPEKILKGQGIEFYEKFKKLIKENKS